MTNNADFAPPIPGYEIQRLLGRGGMAAVYLARQTDLQRDVALKIMNSNLAVDDDFRTRFLNEGHIIAQLNHPNIVAVYDIGAQDQNYYLSMSYLPGGSLKTRIQKGLAIGDSLTIIKQLANALGYAHQRGYIHRDIKPQNVLFSEDGTPILTDFGIAKTIGASAQITRVGMTVGSGNYMSPEQALGKAVDNRSDIYSLGVMFWEMLTGKLPYHADDAVALALQHVVATLPEPPKHLIMFKPILHKLLAKNPELRFANINEFLQALNQLPITVSATTSAAIPAVKQPLPAGSASKRSRSYQPLLVTLIVALPLLLLGAAVGYYAPQFFADVKVDYNEQARQRFNEIVKRIKIDDSATPAVQTETQATQPPATAAVSDSQTEKPEPQVAINKNLQLGRQYLSNAQELIARGAIASSLEQVKKGLQLLPDNAELLTLQTQLQQQQQSEQQVLTEIDNLLQQAEQQWQTGNIMQPSDNNAFESYRQVLALDPNNLQARTKLIEIGRLQLGAKYQQQAQQLHAQGLLKKV